MAWRVKCRYDWDIEDVGLTANKTYTLTKKIRRDSDFEKFIVINDFGVKEEYYQDAFLQPYYIEDDSLETQLAIIEREISSTNLQLTIQL